MKTMYAEIHLTNSQNEKLERWEQKTKKDAEDLVQEFIDSLEGAIV